MERTFSGEMVARLLGFIRPPDTWKDTGEKLWVCASYSQAELKVGTWISYLETMRLAANITTTQTLCVQADWPALDPTRLLIDLQAKRLLAITDNQFHSKIGLQHNRTSEGSKAFTFEYLEPYSNGSCDQYSNCLHCLADSECGWCDATELCVSRAADEEQICRDEDGDWHYLTLHPNKCNNCSNYINCEDCVNVTQNCEWWVDDARCSRRGRSVRGVKSINECPTPCYMRNNCGSCLDDAGRCVWCKSTGTCFSFAVYTSEFQFGMCREWIDKDYVTTTTEYNWSTVAVPGVESTSSMKCKSCAAHTNCSSCLQSLNCGWCFDRDNPIQGVCMQGDFNSSTIECSAVLSQPPNVVEFAYAQCPDVDECGLGIHDCHPEAKCTNTHGSYNCQCRRGFVGDGKRSCIKTCYESCIHGFCSGEPHYRCDCDLGWTGPDCSLNCGCNNHSTCELKGVGVCDECQDWTEGERCERCKPGSYGNATSHEGCRKCECNGHGNKTLGVCDSVTGACFCQDNTEGLSCELCNREYYGDPTDGGRCYFQCEPRGVLHDVTSQGLGSYQSYRPPWGGPETRECLWIINPTVLDNPSDYIIRFEVEKQEMNVSCDTNAIYVYDGLPDLTGVAQQKQLLAVFCSEDRAYPQIVEAKSGQLTIYYKQGAMGQGFNAIYSIESCHLNTCLPPYVCDKDKCSCPEGTVGPNCSVEKCPNGCNAETQQGVCDDNYGRCLCNPGFGDTDCSKRVRDSNLVFTELFNSLRLTESLEHLRKTIPRFGHTLVCDRRGSLWMFGGYSLSHGALNDIRQFDTKNNTWLQVTVDFIPEDKMPEGRYFHAAELIPSKQAIFIHGGLAGPNKNQSDNVLDDFWRFSVQSQRWELIEVKGNSTTPPPLAGHTLTLIKESDKEYLILLGGLSFNHGLHTEVWIFNVTDSTWKQLQVKGAKPTALFGHSTVYHATNQVLYVFGGYQYESNKTIISNKLYALDYFRMQWTELPVFSELNRPSELLPRGRFLHSAVTTENYMLVYGGRTNPHNSSDILIAYVYHCNQWIRLTEGQC